VNGARVCMGIWALCVSRGSSPAVSRSSSITVGKKVRIATRPRCAMFIGGRCSGLLATSSVSRAGRSQIDGGSATRPEVRRVTHGAASAPSVRRREECIECSGSAWTAM
jgi:hypothetical protein